MSFLEFRTLPSQPDVLYPWNGKGTAMTLFLDVEGTLILDVEGH